MASDSEPHAAMSESHAKKGPAILGVAISTTVLALFCVLLRIYIRIRMTRSFWWDDGLIVVAMVRKLAGLNVTNPLMYCLPGALYRWCSVQRLQRPQWSWNAYLRPRRSFGTDPKCHQVDYCLSNR